MAQGNRQPACVLLAKKHKSMMRSSVSCALLGDREAVKGVIGVGCVSVWSRNGGRMQSVSEA